MVNNKENYARYEKEIQELTKRNEELDSEKNQKIEKKERLFANKEKFEKELKEKETELAKITNNLTEKEKEIEGKKSQIEEFTDLKYEKLNEISALDISNENIDKRLKTLKYDTQIAISELDSTNLTRQNIANTFAEIEEKKNKLSSQIDKLLKEEREQEAKLKEHDIQINRLQSDFRMKEARLKFLIETEREKEGYSKTVKSLLLACDKEKDLKKNLRGVLSELISVDKKYQVAIEMVLGGALQNIVTDTEEDAKKLVEYLRKNNLGRATFLPISSVKGKKIDKFTKNKIKGEAIIASDAIKTDKEYSQIILSLLGRTVIVEKMEDAIALAKENGYSFKIVTLKGDLINPSGSISGGSYTQKTVNILGRKEQIKELEEEIKKISEEIKKLEEEKKKIQDKEEDYDEELEVLRQNLQEVHVSYATDEQKLLAVEENLKKLRDRIDKSKEEINEIEQTKKDNLVKKEEINELLKSQSETMDKLKAEIDEFAKLNADNQKYIDDLNFDVTNLKISVSSFNESELSIDEMVERINQDVENNKNSILNKQNLMENILKENEELKNKILEYKNAIKELEEKQTNSDETIVKLKEERNDKNKKLEQSENDISSKMQILDGLKEEIIKIGVKREKVKEDIEEITNKLWNEYELTPNNVGEEYEKPENVAQTSKKTNEIRNKIKDLGNVNVNSIEEYKELSKRYDFMCEQRLDIENTMAKLKGVIQEMIETMRSQFTQQFEIINKNFGEVFKELFGGGRANLILEDEKNILECGIEIIVQPPGKKLQNMTLLSGGERAFTAIALLFAMLKINPSPFCVLDEIEAALDDVNVYRFADYLKKFTSQTQFLVITHRKGTMEAGDSVYGITMEESGISKLLSIKLK